VDVRGEVALRFLALLVCGMLASVALAGQASAPQTGLGTVQGQVLLEPSGQPIRKATVRSSGGGEGGEKFSIIFPSGERASADQVVSEPLQLDMKTHVPNTNSEIALLSD
jgi:hypothetical protein